MIDQGWLTLAVALVCFMSGGVCGVGLILLLGLHIIKIDPNEAHANIDALHELENRH